MSQPIAKRFPAPPIDTLPEDIRTRLLAVQRVGWVERSDTHHDMTSPLDDGFRKGSTHPTGCSVRWGDN
ncbi:hypothetical protein [Bradyrhizobium sp. dw_411]|uniref:hypothetical protein n=1 Tax=Bradyrhizobium sp. dw_411 TaxID=2720082 RepID=UPI001BCAC4C1|nr:hypothetical protein [Bradyrhizobium sp. dw_411]